MFDKISNKKNAWIILWIIVATYLIFSLFIWWEHDDYKIHFVNIWEQFLDGKIDFVYPIGFTLIFAPLYDIWIKLPKLVFVASFLIASFQFYFYIYNNEKYRSVSEKKKFWAVMSLILSPFIAFKLWVGYFDGVIALLILNIFLLLDNSKINPVIKEIAIFALVVLTLSIKFIGLVLIVPFLFYNLNPLQNEGKENARLKKKVNRIILSKIIILIITAGIMGALLLKYNLLYSLIRPFFEHYEREYITAFNHYDSLLPHQPFVFGIFVKIYSILGAYIFIVSLLIIYVYCIKNKVSYEAWIALPVLAFLIFFPISSPQFLIWIVFIFVIFYLRHDDDPNLTKKFVVFQGIGLLLHFFVPFSQFFFLYFVFDIIKKEREDQKRVFMTV